MHIKTYLTGALVAGAVVVSAGTALSGGSQPDAPTVTACANPSGLLKLSDGPCARNEQTVALATGGGLAGVTARLDALEGKVATLQSDNAALRSDVAALKSDNADLKGRVTSLASETGRLKDLLAGVSRDGDTLRFSHMNVQIVNGDGQTSSTNGLGNLIVGYDANGSNYDRDGSHNVVVGDNHGYSSFGGLVAGYSNRISGPYASVSAGYDNTASAFASSVTGGTSNTASGEHSTVHGGARNTASAPLSSVLGGHDNAASDAYDLLPASGLAGYQLVSSSFTMPGSDKRTFSASCPNGMKVLGGGAWLFTNPNVLDISPKVVQSAAIDDDTWEVKIDNTGSARSWDYSLQLTCAPAS